MRVKDLPQEIQNRIAEIQKDLGIIIEEGREYTTGNMFSWAKSPEGVRFWTKIDEGDFEPFYKLYPQIENYSIF